MQDGDVDSTLLVALQVLPSVSIFITGFVSVLIHAHRDRALSRADALEESLKTLVDEDRSGAARELSDLSAAHARALAVRPSGRYADAVNLIILILVLLLSGLVLWQGDWRFTVRPAEISAVPLSLAAIVVVPAVVWLVGWLDRRRVNRDLKARAEATIWGMVAVVDYLVGAGEDLPRAARLADAIYFAVPGALWPLRLRARVHLALAASSVESVEVMRAAETSIAEIDRVLRAKRGMQRSLVPELLLRAEGHSLLGDVQRAVGDLQAALTEQHNNPTLWLQLGALREKLGVFDQARRDYEQAAQLDSLSIGPSLAIARLDLHRQRFDSASFVLEEALDLAPSDSEVRRLYRQATAAYARLLFSRGQFMEVQVFLEDVLRRDSGNSEATLLLPMAVQRQAAEKLRSKASEPTDTDTTSL
jgi:tetratricopeptide (TPR) repeat protein